MVLVGDLFCIWFKSGAKSSAAIMAAADFADVCHADPSKSRKDKEVSAAKTAEELSAGQARQAKAEMKRAKANEAERKAKGSYMQVCWAWKLRRCAVSLGACGPVFMCKAGMHCMH